MLHSLFSTHINSISLKIGRTVGILKKIKHTIPPNILILLNFTLIVPHLHHGILIWGYTYARIYKLRIITGSKYNAHTEPLF